MSDAKKSNDEQVRPCPSCGKPSSHDYRPFCSKRCADVDLARWLKGAYAVPGERDESPPAPDEGS